MTDRREYIATLRAQARKQQRATEYRARMTLPVLSMALLGLFGSVLSVVIPCFLPARPGVWACWGLLLVLYWTIRMAGAS